MLDLRVYGIVKVDVRMSKSLNSKNLSSHEPKTVQLVKDRLIIESIFFMQGLLLQGG